VESSSQAIANVIVLVEVVPVTHDKINNEHKFSKTLIRLTINNYIWKYNATALTGICKEYSSDTAVGLPYIQYTCHLSRVKGLHMSAERNRLIIYELVLVLEGARVFRSIIVTVVSI